jgi:hypothetical protein
MMSTPVGHNPADLRLDMVRLSFLSLPWARQASVGLVDLPIRTREQDKSHG